MTEGYNGYTNHETWLVALWYEEGAPFFSYCDTVDDIAYALEVDVKEHAPDGGLAMDLYNSAVSMINFQEVAQMIYDDIHQEDDDILEEAGEDDDKE